MFCLHPISSALSDETRNRPDTRSRQLRRKPNFIFYFLLFFCLVELSRMLISNDTLHLVFDIVSKMIKNMSSNIIISHFSIFFYGTTAESKTSRW